MPKYEYRRLRGRIVEKYGTLSAFAEASGIPLNTISRKLNNVTYFTQEDIVQWSGFLDIKPEQYLEMYFS